jgi:hypothetical protein
MTAFLKDDTGNLSLGRLLSLLLFFVCTGVWLVIKMRGGAIDNNDMTLIQWGWITAIVGKAAQKFGEKK